MNFFQPAIAFVEKLSTMTIIIIRTMMKGMCEREDGVEADKERRRYKEETKGKKTKLIQRV